MPRRHTSPHVRCSCFVGCSDGARRATRNLARCTRALHPAGRCLGKKKGHTFFSARREQNMRQDLTFFLCFFSLFFFFREEKPPRDGRHGESTPRNPPQKNRCSLFVLDEKKV
nr:hypothetical protein [Pandoravirus massiliensis]